MIDAQANRLSLSDSSFWEQKYQAGTTAWDLGAPAPAFVTLLQSDEAPTPGKIAVLGTGRGHDALWFAQQGFEVVGFDFAPSAIAAATQAAQHQGLTRTQFYQHDIFALPDSFTQQFDYVLEHTCFCAIALAQRPAYVEVVHRLLKPAGEFIALFWAHQRAGGPPFGSTVDEITALFSPNFEVMSLTAVATSPPQRQNEEYLGRFCRKG